MGKPLSGLCKKLRRSNAYSQPQIAWYNSNDSSDSIEKAKSTTRAPHHEQLPGRSIVRRKETTYSTNHGQNWKVPTNLSAVTLRPGVPCLHITGMGTQFAPYNIGPEALEHLARKWIDVSSPNVQKVLSINRRSGIKTRPIIRPVDDIFWEGVFPPSITEVEQIFRTEGVAMAGSACTTAIREAGLSPKDITHIVAVTGTSAGSPGLDLLLMQKLGLSTKVDRVLLSGLGCGGGIAAMRVAANVAGGASARGQVARVLVVAVEVCSTSLRCNMEAMAHPPYKEVLIAPALYSDGASAFVLCNELASEAEVCGFFELVNWTTEILPDSAEDAYSLADHSGWLTTLATSIPKAGGTLLPPAFEDLIATAQLNASSSAVPQEAKDFDWAVHTGGSAILDGVRQVMDLKAEDHLREAYEVYENRGNTSSVSVLAVLDDLRRRRDGRDMAIACSFGPGMFVDLALLRRCQRSRGPPWG